MNSDHFIQVFDIVDSGYRTWTFPAFGLTFVALGLAVALFPTIIRMTGIPYMNFGSRWGVFRRYGMLGFAILWTAVAFFATHSQHLRHVAMVRDNRCQVVEGPVQNFVTDLKEEAFDVSGVRFKYSEFVVTDGFNDMSRSGGPLKAGSVVRICYDPSDNAILRLEIRDYTGPLKDYARTPGFFPQPVPPPNMARGNPPTWLSWFGNLPIVLVIMDIVAIQVLFLPYLRTFFRLKTTALGDWPIPGTLEPGKKTKLRNCMIFWDREHHAIWLRPRGLNFFQVPLAAAVLKVDESGRSITGSEVRFSSGLPVTMALLLWVAYAGFSTTMPVNANGVSLAVFVIGFFGLAMLIVGLLGVRMQRSRMEVLIEDALSELRDMSGPWSRSWQYAPASRMPS
jgi:hypothetical protein